MHTRVIADNNIQVNAQTGSVNLSTFETFGLWKIVFNAGQPKSSFHMASAYIPASTISVTSDLMMPDSAVGVKFYQNVTTVNAFESGLLIQLPLKRKDLWMCKDLQSTEMGNMIIATIWLGRTKLFRAPMPNYLAIK